MRWLLLIPFACLVAMGAGLFALTVASVASPEIGLLIGEGFFRLVDGLFGLAEQGYDPEPAAQTALALLARLGFAVIVAPVLILALISEITRQRSALIQSGVAGLLAAVLPLALLGLSRAPAGAEWRVLGGLFLVGAFSGLIYWLIAGRDAGGTPRVQA